MSIAPIPSLLRKGDFNNESAYFLGAILAANEVHLDRSNNEKIWLASVKHNSGQCPSCELDSHQNYLQHINRELGGSFLNKRQLMQREWFPRNKDGFAFGFRSSTNIGISDLCEYAAYILGRASCDLKRCMLLGAFDGRCSIDVNKATASIRYIALDCGDDGAMQLLSEILESEYLKYNSNFARDRLEGGEPRKPQLRIAARSARAYGEKIGFISLRRMSILRDALQSEYDIVDSNDMLAGLHVLKIHMESHGESIDKTVLKTAETTAQCNYTTTSKPMQTTEDYSAYAKGARVSHKKFGIGNVDSVCDGRITIRFGCGEKTFLFPNAIDEGFIRLYNDGF